MHAQSLIRRLAEPAEQVEPRDRQTMLLSHVTLERTQNLGVGEQETTPSFECGLCLPGHVAKVSQKLTDQYSRYQ